MARAHVSCSDQWKARDQNKNLCPIHWGLWLISFLCSREVWTGGRGVWCNTRGIDNSWAKGLSKSQLLIPHAPASQGGRETSGLGCSTSATEQTHVIQPQPLLPATIPLTKGSLFAHPPNPWVLTWWFYFPGSQVPGSRPALSGLCPKKGPSKPPCASGRQLQKEKTLYIFDSVTAGLSHHLSLTM